MKRMLSLFLTCALLFTSMTACQKTPAGPAAETNAASEEASTDAGTTPATGDIALTISWWGNQTRNERTEAALDYYSEQNPGVTFDGQFAEWNDYWNKLATASAGHSLPDIVQMDYKYLQQYVSNNLLVDLTPYIESGALNVTDVSPSILESAKVDGGIYALAIGINAPALMYNKTLLDENGIQVKDNMTYDEFLAVCREVYEKTGYKTNIAYNDGENYLEYFLRADGFVFVEDGKLGVNSAEDFVPYFKNFETGIAEGWHVEPSIFAERTIGSIEQNTLVYGSSPQTMSWCAFSYSNQLTAMQNAAPEGMEVGMTTWPSKDVKASNYLKPGQFFSVTVDSKNPDEAVKVLDYWTNSVECNEILLAERGVPVSAKVAETIAPKLSDLDNSIITYINDVVTPTSSTINPPAPDGFAEVYSLIKQLEEKLCYGQMTAEEAAQELFDSGNKILAQ